MELAFLNHTPGCKYFTYSFHIPEMFNILFFMRKKTITNGLVIASLILGMLACRENSESKVKSPERSKQVTIGAIRWDAWSGGDVTKQVERTLGPKKYHDRLPWFSEVINDSTVSINGGYQEVMDREIGFAASAGLDYWAFVLYDRNMSMSEGLKLYLESEQREKINFCLILHSTLASKGPDWPIERNRIIDLMNEPGYQTVLGGRPLVYAFMGGGFPFERFQELREEAQKSGLDPYYVFMGWNPEEDYKQTRGKGFDAVSNYAAGGNMPFFTDLAQKVENRYWENAAGSETPYIPLVTTGWDKSPRQDHPVSWELDAAYHDQEIFPSRATTAEIAAHLKKALEFTELHPQICRARSIIIYAWNEYDEGGWIAPTRGPQGAPDSSRLEAIKVVLSQKNAGT